jgi:hypothetical protein
VAVFFLVVGVHFWLFASAQAQSAGQWAISQQPDPLGSYIATQEILLGVSYALMVAFTAYVALLFFAHKARILQVGASAGFTAVLYAFGCFMVGCCGSPMLAVYIGFLGPTFAGLSKPLVLGVTVLSIAYGYWSMAKFRSRDESNGECADDLCACNVAAGKKA